jgi:hypothetical protein|nr:MAG TPA: hypothetical protein [Crassvirales sp.]
MSFIINQNFDLKSAQWNFERDYFKDVASLKAAPETNFPDHFITNVAGVLYQLTKSNSVDATTGKWRKVQLGSDVDLSSYATKDQAIDVASGTSSDKNTISIDFIKADGSQTSVDIPSASHTSAGVMTSNDKDKLDGIAVGANNYVLPTATTAALGGIKTNYTNNGKNYKVDVDSNGNAYVNVPWTDTKTDISKCITLTNEPQIFDSNKELQINYTNHLSIITVGGNRCKFAFDNTGFNLSARSETLSLLSNGIVLRSDTTGTIIGSSNKLFATDGSIFDASKLVTTTALNSFLANYVKSTTLTTELAKYAKLDGSTAFTGIITARGFKLPNGSNGNLLTAGGSIMNISNLVMRSYSTTDAVDFSIDWTRQFDEYTTSDSFVNNTTGFGFARELRGGKHEVLIDSTGAINISSNNIKMYDKSGVDPTNALIFNGDKFSIKSANGTSAQYYAADGSIQTLEKLSNTEIDSIFA